MLTIAESSLLFQSLKFFSSVCIFPFNVDKRFGKLKGLGERKHVVWNVILALLLLHYFHGLFQFVLLLTVRRDQIVLHHLPVQFDGIIIPFLLHPVMIWVFHTRADILVKIFNELYDCDNGVTTRRPLWKLSVQEFLALGFSVVMPVVILLYGGMVVILDDMAHLLINNAILLPLKSSALVVTIATVLEIWSVTMWTINIGFFMTCNCLVLAKMETALPKISAQLRCARYADGLY